MKLINFTTQDIKIFDKDLNILHVLPKTRKWEIRLKTQFSCPALIDDNGKHFLLFDEKLIPAEELPPPVPDTLYVTWANIARAAAATGRRDFIIMYDTVCEANDGKIFRFKKSAIRGGGRIIGCLSFSKV